MDQVEQRGAFTRVGHGVVSILLTELEHFSHNYGPNIPGTIAPPLPQAMGMRAMASCKFLGLQRLWLTSSSMHSIVHLQA